MLGFGSLIRQIDVKLYEIWEGKQTVAEWNYNARVLSANKRRRIYYSRICFNAITLSESFGHVFVL